MAEKELLRNFLICDCTLIVFAFLTVYCKLGLEKHMHSKHRWKLLLSALGFLACNSACVVGNLFVENEFAQILTYINFGAISVLFFIGFPPKLFLGLPKKKN